MIDLETAYKFIEKRIESWINESAPEDGLVILKEFTIHKDWGWVIFYSSKFYIETGDIKYAIAGNAPYIVEKETGAVKETGTAYPIQYYIDEYEAEKDRSIGKWALYIYDAPSFHVLKILKDALGVKISELSHYKDKIPGIVLTGAQFDLRPILDTLVKNDIHSEIMLNQAVADKKMLED